MSCRERGHPWLRIDGLNSWKAGQVQRLAVGSIDWLDGFDFATRNQDTDDLTEYEAAGYQPDHGNAPDPKSCRTLSVLPSQKPIQAKSVSNIDCKGSSLLGCIRNMEGQGGQIIEGSARTSDLRVALRIR
jgi:hypothetical protein